MQGIHPNNKLTAANCLLLHPAVMHGPIWSAQHLQTTSQQECCGKLLECKATTSCRQHNQTTYTPCYKANIEQGSRSPAAAASQHKCGRAVPELCCCSLELPKPIASTTGTLLLPQCMGLLPSTGWGKLLSSRCAT